MGKVIEWEKWVCERSELNELINWVSEVSNNDDWVMWIYGQSEVKWLIKASYWSE